MAGWKTLALNRVELLEDDIRALKRSGVPVPDELEAELRHVRSQHGLSDKASMSDRVTSFWGGDERNHTWDEIHRLESTIESVRPSTKDVVASARAHAEERLSAERRKRFEDDLKDEPEDAAKRLLALSVIQEAHAASAYKHEGERQQQHGIVGLALLLLLGAVTTAILQWRVFPASPLIAPPPDAVGLSTWATLGLVMFFGMVGGGFSALMALYVTNKAYTETYWFDPRPALALMKVSVGVWSAVFGVLGVGTGLVVGTYTNFASLLVLAFLFGYGQQVFTGIIDKKVSALAAGTKQQGSSGS